MRECGEKMKVGIFTDTYFPQVSGVSTSVKLLRDQLVKRGHDVILFTTTDPDSVPEAKVVRLPSIPFASFEDRRIAYGGFDRCLKIAKEAGLEIIHTHTEFSLGLTGRYLASRMKLPTVHTYHTMYENYTHYVLNGHLIQPKHVRTISRMYCNHTDHIIAPSQLTADTLKGYGVVVPIHIIPTGVEVHPISEETYRHHRQSLRHTLGLREEDWVMLSLSRLSKEKQIDQIVDAMPKILAAIPEGYFVIVGDGPARGDLEAQAQALGIERIKFIGEVTYNQVADYYQMADLYLNASESESQGLTYLESVVNLLPIIAKENAFLSSLMTSEAYGRLYPTKEALAETAIEYSRALQQKVIPPINYDDLFRISAERFGQEVEKVYLQAVQDYPYRKRPPKTFERFQTSLTDFVREVMTSQD